MVTPSGFFRLVGSYKPLTSTKLQLTEYILKYIFNITNEDKMSKKYRYRIEGYRYGGEHTIGTIPKNVAQYWLGKGADAFEEYMMSWEHHDMDKDIPKAYRLPEWWEVDNILHVNTVEYEVANQFVIVNEDTDEEIEIDMGGDDLINKVEDTEHSYFDTGKHMTEYVVFGQTFNKGMFRFEDLVLDAPFDKSKFKVNITMWSNLKLVDSVVYDGEQYDPTDEESIGKSSACWID